MALPLIGTAVAWAISKMVWPVVVRIAVGLGVSVTVYSGMNVLLDNLKVQAYEAIGGTSQAALDLAYLAGADQVVSIVFSAIALRFVVSGVRDGARSAMGISPPSS